MTFTTCIVEAAATIAAACPESTVISIQPAIDGASKQPVKARDGAQIYSLTVAGPGVAESVARYHCKDGKGFAVNPPITVYTAIFTEAHRRLSRLKDNEPVSRIINCGEVAK